MYRFSANYMDSCPLNKSAWENASINLNCSRDASRLNRYHCVPNQQRSAVIEFCYDKFSGLYEKETCILLYDNGYLHSVSCNTFTYGCPTAPYLGDEIYEYPACLQIDPIQKCYLADNQCVTPTRETTYSVPTIFQENETSYNTSTAVVNNQTTHNSTGDNSSILNTAVPIVTSICVTYVVIALLLIICLCYKRKRKDSIPSEIVDLGDKGIHNYLQQLENGKVKVYHARGMIVGCARAGKTSLLQRLKGKSVADISHIQSTRSVDIQSDVFAVEGNKMSVISENERISHFDLKQSKIKRTQNVEDDGFFPRNDSDTHIETTALLDVNEDKRKSNIIQETETKPVVVIQDDRDQDVVNIAVDEHSSNRVSERQSSENREEYIKHPIATLKPIQEFEFSSRKKSPKTITFSDFAGHLAYYVTHEIFLNRRAFYLLVIDLSKDLDEPIDEGEMFKGFTYRGIIEHWMKLIYAVHRCAPIILVGTHAKGYKEQDVKEVFKTVWSLMPHQRQVYTGREFAVELIEQEKDPGLEEIKNCICKILVDPGPGGEHIPWGEERPTSWVKYEDYLGKVREENKIIRTEDLWDTIEKEESNTKLRKEEDMRYMLQFFHDTGTVLFFDEVSLREYIVLDVPWFIGAFKHIISTFLHTTEDLCDLKTTFEGDHNESLENLQTYGILTLNLLRAVWNLYDPSYEPQLEAIMMYMERLGMIAGMTTDHKKKNQDTWYIPCLNTKSLSDMNFDGFVFSSSLCFQFQFLPSSIYYRLVATCLNKLGLKIHNWPKSKYIYKDAVLLHDRFEEFECYTLIRHMNEENAIEVQILSQKNTDTYKQRASELKRELLTHLNTLMKSFHCNLGEINIGYRCRIRSPGMKSKTHILSESDFARRPISCPSCNSLQEISGDICSYWNQNPENEEALTQDNDEVQSNTRSRVRGDSILPVSYIPHEDDAPSTDDLGAQNPEEVRNNQVTMSTVSNDNAEPLPHGWEMKCHPTTGRRYYIDHNTRTTHWYPPAKPQQSENQPLPNGWQERRDSCGRIFYINNLTRTSQWTRPTEEAPSTSDDTQRNQLEAAQLFRNRRHVSVEDTISMHSEMALPTSTSGVRSSENEDDEPTQATKAHGASADEDPLLEGWTMDTAPNGRVFYIDHINKVTQWEDPRKAQQYRASVRGSGQTPALVRRTSSNENLLQNLGPLPAGWEERKHADGRVFYIDYNNKVAQWEDPRLQKLGGPLKKQNWKKETEKELDNKRLKKQ